MVSLYFTDGVLIKKAIIYNKNSSGYQSITFAFTKKMIF